MSKKIETRRRYTKEFKKEAVRLVLEEDRPMNKVAKHLDIHEGLLWKWKQDVKKDPVEAFPGNGMQKSQDAEIKRLKKALRDSEMEKDILKKAIMVFSKENPEFMGS